MRQFPCYLSVDILQRTVIIQAKDKEGRKGKRKRKDERRRIAC
jgi:hypothetical protein